MSILNPRKRQSSLKVFNPAKTTLGFSPQRLLPTISENRQLKKTSAKQLSQAISKFTNSNKKQSMCFSDDILRSAIAVVKTFGHVQNNFQQLFEQLFEVLKRFCFVIDDQEILQILKQYRVKPGCSYRKTIIMMDQELENMMKDKNDIISQLNGVMAKLRQSMATKEMNWNKQKQFLEAEADRYKKLANIEYMESLETLVESQKTQISELTAQVNHLLKQNDEYLKQIDHKDNLLHELQFENAQLKTDVYDITRKLDRTDSYFNDLKDRFDGLLVKMMGLKEIIAKVEEENDRLVSERMQLISRAAVSFDDLTPRPKYKDIFGIAMRQHINSTVDIFSNLVEQSTLDKKQIIEKVILSKRNRKLKQAEAIRQKVVEDIIESKQQMKKLEK